MSHERFAIQHRWRHVTVTSHRFYCFLGFLGNALATWAIAGSMAFAKIIEMLSQLQGFLQTQRSLLEADFFAQISQAQAKSILQQLLDFKGEVKPDEGNQFTQTVGHGPWSEEQKAQLRKACSDAMLQKASPRRRPNQHLQSFTHYFSVNDLKLLRDENKGIAVKLDCTFQPTYVSFFFRQYPNRASQL